MYINNDNLHCGNVYGYRSNVAHKRIFTHFFFFFIARFRSGCTRTYCVVGLESNFARPENWNLADDSRRLRVRFYYSTYHTKIIVYRIHIAYIESIAPEMTRRFLNNYFCFHFFFFSLFLTRQQNNTRRYSNYALKYPATRLFPLDIFSSAFIPIG